MEEFTEVSEAYGSLINCVIDAIDKEDSEIATICALPLVKLAEAENGNYVDTIGANYNIAVNTVMDALDLIDREGVPSFLEDDVEEIKRTLKDLGYL